MKKLIRTWKYNFFRIFTFFTFFPNLSLFSKNVQNFVRDFTSLKVYRRFQKFLIGYIKLCCIRKWIQIEVWMYGILSKVTDFTLKLPICCILPKIKIPLTPYYSRGKNSKFYSTSHVNIFFMMKNDCGDDYHNEKAHQSLKILFFQNFHLFFPIYHFFQKMCKTSFGIITPVK